MMNRTGCCGQAWVCPCAGGGDMARIATSAMTGTESFDMSQSPRERDNAGTLIAASGERNVHPCGLLKPEKAGIDGADRFDLERNRLLAWLDRERRHHRSCDDDFSAAQPLAEGREHVGDVAHDADPLTGIGLR